LCQCYRQARENRAQGNTDSREVRPLREKKQGNDLEQKVEHLFHAQSSECSESEAGEDTTFLVE